MRTKFFSKWLQLSVIVLLLLTTFAASPARADATAPVEVIIAAYTHTCALLPTGAVDCWGLDDAGQSEDQPGPYTQVTAGLSHNCALTPSGAAECWGWNEYGQAEDQPGPYAQISAHYRHTCGLTLSGAVDCWGHADPGAGEEPPGPFIQISTDFHHTCALTPAGAVDCWGPNYYGEADDQPGPFTQVSAGYYFTCALTPTGAADCWGLNTDGQADDQPGPYTQISAGFSYTCALTPTGSVDCWGLNDLGQANDQPGPYTQVSTNYEHTCALTTSGAVDCWGDNYAGRAEDQPGPYDPYNPIGDTIPPVVTVTGVTQGSTYILGAVPQAGCSTTDEGSGVAVEASLTLSGGNSLGVGAFTATCSGAFDNAGNAGNTAVVNYNVAFQFTGFLAPVDNSPIINVARAGQVIPLKWRLTDTNGNPVLNLTNVSVTATSLSCETGTIGDTIEEYAAGSDGLQNLGDGYYQWNWKTPKNYANSCKTLRLDLGESTGSEHTALFQFK